MRSVLSPNLVTRDIVPLVSRIILGIVLIAHGYQKFALWGLAGTGQAFAGMGVPMPGISAVVAAVIELAGGILLVLGVFTPIVAVVVFLEMIGAALLVHLPHGVFVGDGGWELVGALGAGTLALAAGAGRFSIDGLLRARTSQTAAATGSEREFAEVH
ncbi:DoxX family protein [Raineyella fluvialis]|uniref:DoxX family membrane protein n=1 Tax=Raineyella fluvialis TaxID=2662261 RepID=A0A5Q2FHP9_9ACTN|nr:DoxX family protein [Raineyella fluvialis]QGF24185.1 DoxX family membrane protein [Raineyella fluvialis]